MRLLKQLLLLNFCVVLAVMVKANGKGTGGGNDGIVLGQVTDAVTKKPIPGVMISMVGSKIGNVEITTDPDGNFRISKLPKGEFTLLFEKKGYKIHKRELVNTKQGVVYKITLDMLKVEELSGEAEEYSQPLLRMSGIFRK